MTRINLVHPSELHRKHLVAEFRELPRVFSLARKAQYDMHKRSQPNEYTLGKGHVIFWYTRLQYLSDRYDQLCLEMQTRGYTCNRVPKQELEQGIDRSMFFGYNPTEKALAENRQRIKDRQPK